jgi:DNA-binding response OmpR family regulator
MDAPHGDPAWSFAPFVLDCARRTLSRNGQPVTVTPKAFDILAVLAASGGQLVTKETIIDFLGPETSTDADGHQERAAIVLGKVIRQRLTRGAQPSRSGRHILSSHRSC